MISKHYRANDNDFINQEPTFESENVYTHSVELNSDQSYRIDNFVVDGQPTSHYAVLFWRGHTLGQKIMFIDASKPLGTSQYKPVKVLRRYLKSLVAKESK